MIFLVQFRINKHLLIFFQRPQVAVALRAREILLVFEKIYSCLFIPNWLEIMCLPILINWWLSLIPSVEGCP